MQSGSSKSGYLDPGRVLTVARAVGLALETEVAEALASFGDLFLSWNDRINLGGKLTTENIVDQHFIDSFVAAAVVPRESRVIDVGSGGGLPAVPLALLRPDIHIDLFEPTGKKVAFLRTAVRSGNLQSRVLVQHGRVAAGAAGLMENYDVAMSRATMSPTDWLPLGRRLIRNSGVVLVYGASGTAALLPTARTEIPYGSGRRLFVFGKNDGKNDEPPAVETSEVPRGT